MSERRPRIYPAVGERFTRLTYLEPEDHSPSGKSVGLFRCDCGVEKPIIIASIRSGLTLSCGCYNSEKTVLMYTKHGARSNGERQPEYSVWEGMRARCRNPKDSHFHLYGGKGVSVCERWNSYANFLDDMGRRPSDLHSIERNDSNGNYEPSNCRWATQIEQCNNTSRNRFVEIDGQRMTLAQACGGTGGCYQKVYARHVKLGWPIEKALRL